MNKSLLLVEYLQDLVDKTIPINDPYIFILQLHAYVTEIFTNSTLEIVIKKTEDEGENNCKRVIERKLLTIDEINLTGHIIQLYINEKNDTNQKALEELVVYQTRIRDKLDEHTPFKDYEHTTIISLFEPLEKSLFHIINGDNACLIAEYMPNFSTYFCQGEEVRRINTRRTFPNFWAYIDERESAIQTETISGVLALNKLREFFNSYDCKTRDALIDKLERRGQSTQQLKSQSLSLREYVSTGNTKSCEDFFTIDAYKHFMVTFLNCIKKTLLFEKPDEVPLPEQSRKKTKIKKHKLKWPLQSRWVAIDGKIVPHKFTRGKGLARLLDEITKGGTLSKEIDIVRIYNAAKKKSEFALDGRQKKAARNVADDLDNIFIKNGYPAILDITNNKGYPDLYYELD